jgi:hypothetical protein
MACARSEAANELQKKAPNVLERLSRAQKRTPLALLDNQRP